MLICLFGFATQAGWQTKRASKGRAARAGFCLCLVVVFVLFGFPFVFVRFRSVVQVWFLCSVVLFMCMSLFLFCFCVCVVLCCCFLFSCSFFFKSVSAPSRSCVRVVPLFVWFSLGLRLSVRSRFFVPGFFSSVDLISTAPDTEARGGRRRRSEPADSPRRPRQLAPGRGRGVAEGKKRGKPRWEKRKKTKNWK